LLHADRWEDNVFRQRAAASEKQASKRKTLFVVPEQRKDLFFVGQREIKEMHVAA